MTSTILRPEILVIGNRSYRINPSSLPGLESTNQQHREVYREEDESDYYLSKNDTYDDEPSCIPKRTHPPQEIEAPPVSIAEEEADDEDDDTIEYVEKDKMFVCEMDIATPFYGVLIGKNAETKTKLERDTNTQILFPRRDETGRVKIRGREKSQVQSARTRMEIIIDQNRQNQAVTHFLSLPLCQSANPTVYSFKEKYEQFKKQILKDCGTERGVNEDLFQQVNKLHLTVTTFVLLSRSEIDFMKETIGECVKSLIDEFIPKDEDRFVVQVKGLQFMNDDPSFVDVLYAKINLIHGNQLNRLQKFLDRLNEELAKTGLMKQKFERLKLHVTVMNSLLRRDDTGILEAQKNARGRVKYADRESFDASKILRLFGQYDFGQIELDKLHLSIMHEPNRKTGYYGCEAEYSLQSATKSSQKNNQQEFNAFGKKIIP